MVAATATTPAGARPVRAGRRLRLPAWLGPPPFLAYVGLFLLLPTGIIVFNAFRSPSGALNLPTLKLLFSSTARSYFIGSFQLCLISSAVGAVLGAILAYAIASGDPDGVVRRLYIAVSGVLAQFGGVTLAFAFVVTIGPVGLLFHASWYYSFPWGIAVIYAYFQIPLMVLVFLPAIVAWENQIAYIVPQQIYVAINSEVGLSSVNQADVLALGMIIMVAIVMTGYVLLQLRAARWLFLPPSASHRWSRRPPARAACRP